MKTLNHLIKNANRWEILFLVVLLGASLFLRAYRLPEYMTFLGDEGRDAVVIKELLVDYHFPFIGPPTSVGNMYLGPLYYYMMAFSMTIFWLNPVAAAGMNVVIGLLSIGLIYYLAKKWFGIWPAITAATLYSLSPVVIYYSRSSWNPNPAPFFALIAIWSLDKVRDSKNFLWLLVTGFAVAAAAQMHYLALILIAVTGIIWLILNFFFKKVNDTGSKTKNKTLGAIGAVVVFLLMMSPLIVFDLRHDYMNYKAFSLFFSDRQTTVNLNILNSINRVSPLYYQNLVGSYIVAGQIQLQWILSALLALPIIKLLLDLFKKKQINWPLFVLTAWLIGSLMGLSLYKQSIYDHYLGFMAPVVFLLIAATLSLLKPLWKGRVVILASLIVIGVIGYFQILKTPLMQKPNMQLQRSQNVAKYVIAQADRKPYNFALISKNNYDAAYQFFLEQYQSPPALVQNEITEQLFVVCEDPVCQPINSPKYEIAAFGWSKVETEADFNGTKIFKLIHNPDGKPAVK